MVKEDLTCSDGENVHFSQRSFDGLQKYFWDKKEPPIPMPWESQKSVSYIGFSHETWKLYCYGKTFF